MALIPELPGGARIAALGGAGIALLAALELDRLTIVVTDTELIVGFHLFKSRTPIQEIASARPVHVKVGTHGIGVHYAFSGALAFTARAGPGVEVARKERRPLVFSSDDPSAVLRALVEAGAAGVASPP